MSSEKLRTARERLEEAGHLIHLVETNIREGRPVEADQLRAIRTLLDDVKHSLRRRRTPTGTAT